MSARKKASAKKRNLLLGIGVLVVVLVVIVVILVIQSSKPASLEERAKQFADAWNERSHISKAISRLGPFFLPDRRERMLSHLERSFKRYKWLKERPQIRNPEIPPGEWASCLVKYRMILSTINEPLTIRWNEDKKSRWFVASIIFPKGLLAPK